MSYRVETETPTPWSIISRANSSPPTRITRGVTLFAYSTASLLKPEVVMKTPLLARRP
jgi:hypothetical protein